MSNLEGPDSAEERVQDVKVVEEALNRAVSDALRQHKQAGRLMHQFMVRGHWRRAPSS